MDNVNHKIEKEMERILEQIGTMNPEEDEYKRAVDSLAVLQRSKTEMDRLEFEDRKNGDQLTLEQMEQEQKLLDQKNDQKRFTWRMIADAAGIVIPAVIYIFFGIKGFQFEETGTFTSQTHRNNMANIFKFHR